MTRTRPLILLHGALGSKEHFHPLIQALGSAEVHTFNFEGHGGRPSDRPYSIAAFSENLTDYIRKNELEKADIFGYSMGGYVALKTALDNPGLIGNIITLGTKFDWSPESAAKEVKMLDPEKIQEKVPAFANALKNRHHPLDWKEVLSKTADMMIAMGSDSVLKEDDLKAIHNQVSVCRGEEDRMVSEKESRWAAEHLPKGRFLQLEGVPHPIEKVPMVSLLEVILQGLGQ
jgi:pimeloyl-ACP methyl ester carboxylesterase